MSFAKYTKSEITSKPLHLYNTVDTTWGLNKERKRSVEVRSFELNNETKNSFKKKDGKWKTVNWKIIDLYISMYNYLKQLGFCHNVLSGGHPCLLDCLESKVKLVKG